MQYEFIATCPFCDEENILDFSLYSEYLETSFEMKDICRLCGNEYAFDLELIISATTYVL